MLVCIWAFPLLFCSSVSLLVPGPQHFVIVALRYNVAPTESPGTLPFVIPLLLWNNKGSVPPARDQQLFLLGASLCLSPSPSLSVSLICLFASPHLCVVSVSLVLCLWRSAPVGSLSSLSLLSHYLSHSLCFSLRVSIHPSPCLSHLSL